MGQSAQRCARRERALAVPPGSWATVLLFLLAAFLPAAPASAHATLLFTSPAVDGAVPDSPPVVQLVFDQPVVASQSSLTLKSTGGDPAGLGEVQRGEDSSVLRAEVLERLPAGEYRVDWQVVAQDGDSMVGDFRFVVGSGSVLTSTGGEVVTRGAWPLGALRWLFFTGLATALGGLVGARLVHRAYFELDVEAPSPWLKAGVGAALLAAVGLAVLVAGTGSLAAGLDPDALKDLHDSFPGLVALAEVGALVVALVAVVVGRRWLAGMALLAVPVAEGFRAHPQVQAGGVGVAVIAVHLSAVAVWVGALLYVIRVGIGLRRKGLKAVPVVRAYARMAMALFLVVFATGTLAALIVIPWDDWSGALFETSYGRWLLVKLGFVMLVVALAAWARHHLRRRPEAPQPALSARYELGAISGILAISSALTVLAPPVSANIPLAFPPPDVGPAIGLGTRAGYVGIAVSASQGQIVVKLTTPKTPLSEMRSQSAIDLRGNTVSNGAEAQDLQFRRCGLGCFVAPTSWAKGDNVVSLRVDDQEWGGGRAAVKVPWPPRPAEPLLEAAADRMRTVDHFALYEQVTSDTATGLGPRIRLRLSGEEYLAAGPFSSGRAVTVSRYQRHRNGEVTLALAYPAEKVFVLLTVDAQSRIVREVLTSGEHLVTRTLVYDEPRSHEGHHHEDQ